MENNKNLNSKENRESPKSSELSDDSLTDVSGGFGIPSMGVVTKLIQTAKGDGKNPHSSKFSVHH